MKNQITITRLDNGYIVTVDGASKECATWPEALAIIESEGGIPLARAHRELFERCKTLEQQNAKLNEKCDVMTADRDKYKSWWAEAYDENRQLKAAICKWFLRAFKEG